MATSPSPFPSEATEPAPRLLDLLNASSITSLIIDAEIVAVDKDTGAYRTFQDLSNRAKKDVQVEDIKVVVGVFAFDLMLLNDTVSPRLAPHRSELMPGRHCWSHRSHTADTCCIPSSHPSLTPRTLSSLDFHILSPLTRQAVSTSPQRCRRSLRVSSSRSARDSW